MKKKATLIFLLFFCFAFFQTKAQTSFVSVSDADTQSDPGGTNAVVNMSQWCNPIFKFDLSTFSGAINTAKVRLYFPNGTPVFELNIAAASIDSWTEGNAIPGLGSAVTTFLVEAGIARYIEVDITAHVQSKMMGNKTVTLILYNNLNNWSGINSRQAANNKPEIVVTSSNGPFALTIVSTNGTVVKNPDLPLYATGTSVQLTATPNSGYLFDGWSGGATGNTNPLTIIMSGPSAITANFSQSLAASTLLDPNATAGTVTLWNYLKSIYGTKMLTGVWTENQYGGNTNVVNCTSKTPAIWGQDMSSWYRDRNDPLWSNTWNGNIAGFKNAHSRKQILQVNWHWQMVSSKVNGVYTRDAWGRDVNGVSQMMTNQQWADIVTPGTALYNAMIEDVDYHIVNFLKKIVDNNGVPIPIIFRPMHEIDGGWFWWTCASDPAKTATLFKILQDRIINFHGCHNLIWVYNPGVLANGGSWPPYQTSEYARRRAFYPGDAYCDITGIDLYGFDPVVRGTYFNTGKTYRDAWNVMKAISASKMIALCEAEGMPDAAKSFTDPTYAPWLYCLPWFTENYYDENTTQTRQLCAWNNIQFNSPYVLNATDIILPVKLRNFTAALNSNQTVKVGWVSAEESNLSRYEIEGSTNGIDFIPLKSIPAKGSNSSYLGVVSLLADKTFYRLRMIDLDGKFKYSNIVFVQSSNKTTVSIFPNPANDKLIITHDAVNRNATIEIMNAVGKKLILKNLQQNSIQSTIDVSKLTSGLYILLFNNGTTRNVLRFNKL